jgi:hypothetical protein
VRAMKQQRRYAEGTTVPVEKSRAEIEKLVSNHGASRFASGWEENRAAVSFALRGRLVRFVLNVPTLEDWRKARTTKGRESWMQEETRRRWRCLLLALKAKLEVVETGIASFDEEFLAHIVTDGNLTVYERIKLAEENGQRMLPAVTS